MSLILRSERSERLEGWPQATELLPSFEARLRRARQDAVSRMPEYVERILMGANPAEMPIEVIGRSELAFNLKTAREIGVTIPRELLKRADRTIQ